MRSILLLTAATLISIGTALAAFQGLPDKVVSTLPAIDKTPGYSVLLWVDESYELAADGRQIYEIRSFRYLPDEASRDHWGDPHVAFIEGKQRLDVITSRAYTPDGRIVDSTPENAFNPITPFALEEAPELTHFRQMVITHLGLENGCIVELHYRLTNSEPLLPWLEGRVELRDASPTAWRRLSVTVPEGTQLHFAGRGGAPEPEVPGNSHVWTVSGLAGYSPDDLAGQHDLLPHVVFSTAKDWKAVQSEMMKRIRAAQTGEFEIPESLNEKLMDALDMESRLETVKSWVHERYNRLQFPHSEFPVTLRPAADVLNSGYGNHLETAVMVSALLEKIGIDAFIVLQFEGESPLASLTGLENALLQVRLEDRDVPCDAILPQEDLPRLDLADCTLLSLGGAGDFAEVYVPAHKGYLHLAVAFTELDGEEVHGHGTLSASGRIAPQEAVKAAGASGYIEGFIGLEGFTCKSATMRELFVDRVILDFEFTASALEEVDDYRLLPLSLMDFSMISHDCPLKLPEREFSQQLLLPADLSLTVDAVIPDDWELTQQPEGNVQQTDWMTAETVSEVKDGRFHFQRGVTLKTQWIEPSMWPQFRSAMLAALPQPANTAVFKASE